MPYWGCSGGRKTFFSVSSAAISFILLACMISGGLTITSMTHAPELVALSRTANDHDRHRQYTEVLQRLELLIQGETDWIAILATVACELHHAFDHYDWTGFYRAIPGQEFLVIGPYQGHLGCLRIPFGKGVCGAAAKLRTTQLVPDTSKFEGYIACASSTQSELVVPVLDEHDHLLAVLDVDCDDLDGFHQVDKDCLEDICKWLGSKATTTQSTQTVNAS